MKRNEWMNVWMSVQFGLKSGKIRAANGKESEREQKKKKKKTEIAKSKIYMKTSGGNSNERKLAKIQSVGSICEAGIREWKCKFVRLTLYTESKRASERVNESVSGMHCIQFAKY